MNIYQQHSSNEHIQPQNTKNIWGISNSVNHIQKQWLKSYLYKKNWKKIVCFVWKENLIEYAFDIWKQITAVNKFELCTLKAKWLWQKSNSDFLPKIIKDNKNISKLNNKINDYIINQSKQADINSTRNPDFPDGTFMYTNQYWKEFKIVILWGKAINITCDNNYITGHQKGAIQRAINENRLEKFEDFIPKPCTQLSVVNKTNKILEWDYLWKDPWLSNIDNTNFYENVRKKISDSSNLLLSADYIENIYTHVENFDNNQFPTIQQLEAAQSFIAIMHKRTWVEKSSIADLLQTAPTINYIFDNIDNSIWNEWYNITFIQVLLQLSEIIKNIFLSTVTQEKRAYH